MKERYSMEMSPEKYIQRLNEILQKKILLLQDILVLTKAQAEVINEDEIDSLNKLIDKKQTKIDVVNELDEEFNVYFQRLKSSLGVKSIAGLDASGLEGAKELKDVTAEILNLINRISELEKQNTGNGKSLLDHLGGEIKKINQNKKVSSAYSPGPVSVPSYFIDKKK
jgi:hypothetical protein